MGKLPRFNFPLARPSFCVMETGNRNWAVTSAFLVGEKRTSLTSRVKPACIFHENGAAGITGLVGYTAIPSNTLQADNPALITLATTSLNRTQIPSYGLLFLLSVFSFSGMARLPVILSGLSLLFFDSNGHSGPV